MNTLIKLDGVELWPIAGWTMLHFLWLGAIAGFLALMCRLMLRRAPANVRYTVALVWFALLAVMPVAIAGWLVAKPQAIGGARAAAGSISPITIDIPADVAPAAPDSVGGPSATGDANEILAPQFNPRQSRGLNPSPTATSALPLAVFALEVCAKYLPWLWLLGTPITFALTASGMIGAERLRRTSRPIHVGPIVDALSRLASSLRVTQRVSLAVCERIATPVLIGIVRPTILLPSAAITGWSPDEIEMVLLHELAHVRRWDNLVNLVQRMVESLLFFHPAVWLLSGWVRREREACCDAAVVARTNRPHAYAEMLVALAAQMPRSVLFHPAATSAMAAGPLRSRIRRILQLEDDPMLVSGKSFAVVVGSLIVVATLAVLNLPTRGQAKESNAESAENAEKPADIAKAEPPVSTSDDWPMGQVFPSPKEVSTKVTGKSDIWNRWTENEWLRSLFAVSEQNPLQTKSYRIPESLRRKLSDAVESFTQDPHGPKLKFEYRWIEDKREFAITAPKNSHDAFFSVYVPLAVAAESERLSAVASDADSLAEESIREVAESNGVAGTRRYGMGGNLPIEVSDEEGQRIVTELLKDPAVQRASINRTPDGMQSLYVGIKEPAGKKAFLSWKTNSEGKLGCSIGFIETPGATSPDASRARQDVHDRFPSLEDQKFIKVPFVQGATSFKDGDSITILEVRGTAKTFQPGNIYWIKGTYTLRSHDRATLLADTTAMDAAHGTSPSLSVQSTKVDRGKGTFSLFLPMSYRGWPHVSFYPADGGEGFGGIYFGTGDSVLKQWWGSNEEVDAADTSDTEKQPSDEDVRKVTIAISDHQTATAESQPGRLRLQVRTTGSKSGTFPSLEDQKLADLAWKRLNLELEPIGEEDLKRVQALGYDGGVIVKGGPAVNDGIVKWNDILVGLHVWPTTSLKDVATILSRDDLAELNPLKFYVVRSQVNDYGRGYGDRGGRGGGSGSEDQPREDKVITGRISVSIESGGRENAYGRRGAAGSEFDGRHDPRYSSAQNLPAVAAAREGHAFEEAKPQTENVNEDKLSGEGASNPFGEANADLFSPSSPRPTKVAAKAKPAPVAAPAANPSKATTASASDSKSSLRYEGMTFDEWRMVWRNELSTEKRLEAVIALAAFGRAGYGKQATEAILDVAGEYDFDVIDSSSEGKLKQTVLDVLAPEGKRPWMAELWLPDLATRIEKEPAKWKWLALFLLDRVRTDDPETIAILQSLAESGPAEIRDPALGSLVLAHRWRTGQAQIDGKTRELLTDALKSNDPVRIRAALPLLVYDDPPSAGGLSMPRPQLAFQPELIPLLFHPDESVRREARGVLQHIQEEDVPAVVPELTAVLQDESRQRDQIHAIRALAAMGRGAASPTDELWQFFGRSDDQEINIAAVNAIVEMSGMCFKANSVGPHPDAMNIQSLLGQLANKLDEQKRNELATKQRGIKDFVPRLVREANSIVPPRVRE